MVAPCSTIFTGNPLQVVSVAVCYATKFAMERVKSLPCWDGKEAGESSCGLYKPGMAKGY